MRLVLDVETTITNKGNPFTDVNQLVVVGVLNIETNETHYFWYPDLTGLQDLIDSAEILIGFNIKFDLHWLRRCGINIDLLRHRVWDCQLAEFILENQSKPYPSLNWACEKYGLPLKEDVVKTQYWDNGIDTIHIPRDILTSYLYGDLVLTGRVYHHQLPQIIERNQLRLFSLQCQDLLVLEDMEYNGMMFNTEKSYELAKIEEQKITEIENQLKQGYENIPINWESGDHLSCYLYGGAIVDTVRLPIGVYKTGAKQGQPRYKLVDYTYDLPKQVEPPKGSELKKEGYYATNDQTLRSIRGTAEVRKRVNLILERAKSAKLAGTYYNGLPNLISKMGWPNAKLHGQFNQCVAATGRLSSTNPNLQNFAREVKELLVTRYV
jgi:DNA polymerase I-like protein with 3'-5' exonuclease and polymerase domains